MIEHKIGDKVNNWTVIELIPRDKTKGRKPRCIAQCSCGTITETTLYGIHAAKGCKKCGRITTIEKRRKFPEIGSKIAKWTVLDTYIGEDNKGWVKLQCECGTIKHKKCSDRGNQCFKCKTSSFKGKPAFHSRTGYEDISGTYFTALRIGAETRKHDFTITIEYLWELFLKQDRKCALSRLDLKMGYYIDGEQTASVDRIDNDKGYIEGNVQWIHKDINKMKHAFHQDYFIDICHKISNKFK